MSLFFISIVFFSALSSVGRALLSHGRGHWFKPGRADHFRFHYAFVAQLAEHFLGKEEVMGSSPVKSTMYWLMRVFASVAQLVDQRTKNPCVVGSIPTRGTIWFYAGLV